MARTSKRATDKGKAFKGSSTAGRMKGANCHKSQTKTQYCKDTRFYRNDPSNYEKICKQIDELNK